MSDVHSKKIRSYNMSKIKGKDTKPEIMLRKELHRRGFRFRLHVKGLPGKPDIVLPKHNTVIFVQGCFWHAHEGCKYFKIPKTRSVWWSEKLMKNRERDQRNMEKLKELGWNVIEVWECSIKKSDNIVKDEDLVRKIVNGKT